MGLEMKLCKLNTLTIAFELLYLENPAAWGAFPLLRPLSFLCRATGPSFLLSQALPQSVKMWRRNRRQGKLSGIVVLPLLFMNVLSLGDFVRPSVRLSVGLSDCLALFLFLSQVWPADSMSVLQRAGVQRMTWVSLPGTGPSSTTLSSPCFSENSVIKQHNTIHLSSTFCCWYLFVLLWLFYFLTICSSVNNVTELCWYMLRNITVMLAGPTNLILHLLNRTILCVREEVRTV